MNGSPIRLALVGSLGSVTEQSPTLQRIREVVVTVTAESMKAALQSDIDSDAAIDTGGRTILDARISRQITTIVNAAIQSGRSGKSEDVRPMSGAR